MRDCTSEISCLSEHVRVASNGEDSGSAMVSSHDPVANVRLNLIADWLGNNVESNSCSMVNCRSVTPS